MLVIFYLTILLYLNIYIFQASNDKIINWILTYYSGSKFTGNSHVLIIYVSIKFLAL